jgi:hypothetical protein
LHPRSCRPRHEILRAGGSTLAIGGDIAAYHIPEELQDSYGRPVSYHLFVRWTVDASR